MRRILHLAFVLAMCGAVIFSCKKELSCESCFDGNHPPIANAGPDQSIKLPTDSASLDGTASRDTDGSISSFRWTRVAGPATFAIHNAAEARTIVKNLEAGDYRLELTVTDNGGLSSSDTVLITVSDSGTRHLPPLAFAGNDTSLNANYNLCSPAPTIITLNGNGSKDPDGTIVSWQWSGPGNIADPNSSSTQVSNLFAGTHSFILRVMDGDGLTDLDTVVITILAATTRPNRNAQLVHVKDLSLMRREMEVVAAGNKILFAGGYLPSYEYSSRVDILDLSTNTWSTAELSQPRAHIASAVLGNKIFFAGGDLSRTVNGPVSDRVDIYDVVTNTWSIASLSQGRTYLNAAAAGNKVLFAGGSGISFGSGGETNRVDIYDLSTNTWTVETLPGRGTMESLAISVTAIGNEIYFAGAAGDFFAWDFGGEYSSVIDIYDAVSGSWGSASLNDAKGDMAAIAVGNKNYWAGGRNGLFGTRLHPLSTVEIREVNSATSTIECLFQPNSGFSAVTRNTDIVFFTTHTTQGEWLIPGIVTNKFDIYNYVNNIWSIGVLPVNIYDASIISVNNIIYVAGGVINGNPSGSVWKLEY